MKQLHAALLGLCLVFIANTAHAQARLTIVNKSQRQMTVKVMQTAAGKPRTRSSTDRRALRIRTGVMMQSATPAVLPGLL